MLSSDDGFRLLLRKTTISLLICAVLVAICYFFVDRPVAFFVHAHHLPRQAVLEWLTLPPPILQAWSPLVLTLLAIRRTRGPFRNWELALLAASLGVIVADQFRVSLAWVFGRYWPATWIDDNPSLIGSGAYGFHPFHSGSAYGSFPSGHATRMLAIASVVWIAFPRWRWLAIIASLAIATALIGMNYHFVGDVIAGGFVGGIVGTYAAQFAGLSRGGENAHLAQPS